MSPIDQFFDWLDDQLRLLQTVPYPHSAICYATCIDVVARAVFPNTQSNKRRYVDVIDQISEWPYRDLVSLPQIVLAQASLGCPALHAEARSRVARWTHGGIPHGLEVDPPASDLIGVQEATPAEQVVAATVIEACRYARLMYNLRNSLVHEMRLRAPMFPLGEQPTQPYYHGSIVQQGHWDLVIPPPAIQSLAEHCSRGARAWFTRNGGNPYDGFPDVTSWL